MSHQPEVSICLTSVTDNKLYVSIHQFIVS